MGLNFSAKVGDVIRVWIDSPRKDGDNTLVGVLESIDIDTIILRPQELIEVEVKGKSAYVIGVTADDSSHLGITIKQEAIYAYELASYTSLVENRLFSNFVEFDESLLKDIKAEISESKYFPRKLHFYDKDDFCVTCE